MSDIYLPIYLPTYLPIYLPIYPSIHLSKNFIMKQKLDDLSFEA